MIVDQSHGLHERIAGGGPDEFEPALAQVLAQPHRRFRLGELAQVFPAQVGRTMLGMGLEAPEIGRERPEFLLQLERPSDFPLRRLG